MSTRPDGGVHTLRLVLGDQLSDGLAALDGLDPARDLVLMAEVRDECTYVRHHKKKLVLVLSGMRHHAERLRQRGVRVRYVAFDDPDNTHSLRGEMLRAVAAHAPARIVVTEPGEWRLLDEMAGWQDRAGCPVEILDDTRFLCAPAPVPALGGRPPLAAHGVLLPRDAPRPRPADGRGPARRRPLELRRREPQAACRRAWCRRRRRPSRPTRPPAT